MTANGLRTRSARDYEGATHFALAPYKERRDGCDGSCLGPVFDGSLTGLITGPAPTGLNLQCLARGQI